MFVSFMTTCRTMTWQRRPVCCGKIKVDWRPVWKFSRTITDNWTHSFSGSKICWRRLEALIAAKKHGPTAAFFQTNERNAAASPVPTNGSAGSSSRHYDNSLDDMVVPRKLHSRSKFFACSGIFGLRAIVGRPKVMNATQYISSSYPFLQCSRAVNKLVQRHLCRRLQRFLRQGFLCAPHSGKSMSNSCANMFEGRFNDSACAEILSRNLRLSWADFEHRKECGLATYGRLAQTASVGILSYRI